MQRNYQFHRDKKLLALEREDKALSRRRRTMVTIDPPVQRGWVRRWRLAKWAEKHPQRTLFEEILREVQTEQRISIRPSAWAVRLRRKLHITGQGFQRISAARWSKLKWTSAHRAYFRPEYRTTRTNRFITFYRLATCHMFDLKAERHWIHTLPLHQPELESRLSELSHLIGAIGEHRLDHLHGKSDRDWWDHYSTEKAIKKAVRKQMVRIRQGEWDAEKRRRSPSPLLSIPDYPLLHTGASANMQAT